VSLDVSLPNCRNDPHAADGITPSFMDGDARSKVGYGRETGENMLSSRFTAHEPDTAITIAASYAAKAFGIKTGTLAREARQLCPNVIPVQANHRLYTDYPERILATVDTCLPIEKIMPFDGMVCRLTSAER